MSNTHEKPHAHPSHMPPAVSPPGEAGSQEEIPTILSLTGLWWLVLPAAIFCIAILRPVQPNDFWWHIRTGQIILDTGQIPTIDTFSFTRSGETWINQSWLMQVILYYIYSHSGISRNSGLAMILIFHSLLLTGGYTLVLNQVGRRWGVRVGVLATALGAAIGIMNWAVRPQIASFLFFGLLIYLIEEHRAGRTRKLWWSIPLFALWVNSHGGFIFGLGALGLYVIGRLGHYLVTGMEKETRRDHVALAANGLLALAAVGLNPQGPVGIANYVLGFFRSDVTIQQNIEFVPLTVRYLDGAVLFVVLLVLVFCLLRTRWRLQPDQVLSLLAFLALALWTRRGMPWLGFVLIPLLAQGLDQLWSKRKAVPPGKPALNGIILAMLGIFVLLALPWWRGSLPLQPKQQVLASVNTPVAAVPFLCTGAATTTGLDTETDSGAGSGAVSTPEGLRVFQHFAFASYQIWACPGLPVFADTRIELYDGDIWGAYFAISQGRFDWEEIAARYNITHLMLDPMQQAQGVRAAQASACWSQIFEDDTAIIFARQAGCP